MFDPEFVSQYLGARIDIRILQRIVFVIVLIRHGRAPPALRELRRHIS